MNTKKPLILFLLLHILFYYSPISAQCNLDFSSNGPFAFTKVNSTDIVNAGSAGSNDSTTQSFNVWDEANLDCGTPGGLDDITFEIKLFHVFDLYKPDSIIDAYAGTTHDVTQTTSGLKGSTPLGNSTATESSTGDIRGYQIKVSFASHVNILASDITVNTKSINTAGGAFESAAIIFLDETGTAYGTADYKGYYGDGSPGPSTTSCSVPIVGSPWLTSGSGVFIAANTGTVDITNPCNVAAGTTGPNDTKNVNAATDAGLNNGDRVGGFIFMVYLEDVAASNVLGAETNTSAGLSSTLKGITLANNPLPIELKEFTAKKENENIMLEWTTLSELNNEWFDIEHSTDGKTFDLLNTIAGAGSSLVTNNYHYLHQKPNTGTHYYRLKQIDFDGQFSYSPTRVVEMSSTDKFKFSFNQNDKTIHVEYKELQNSSPYRIIGLNGQILVEGNLESGSTSFKTSMEYLPKGYYIFTTIINRNIVSKRFVQF